MKLVAFGCSFTYGDGLPDAHGFKNPSKDAWPQVLANTLGYECDNTSVPGNSNSKILYDIVNYPFVGNEVVCIMWTYNHREHVFKSEDSAGYAVHGDLNSDEYKFLLSLYNDYSAGWKSWQYIHHADLYLKSKQVPTLHWMTDIKVDKPNYFDIGNIVVEQIPYIDYASDKQHPGYDTHKLMAEKFNTRITNVLY